MAFNKLARLLSYKEFCNSLDLDLLISLLVPVELMIQNRILELLFYQLMMIGMCQDLVLLVSLIRHVFLLKNMMEVIIRLLCSLHYMLQGLEYISFFQD